MNEIFTDKAENRELLVPGSIIALGMFFTGRILTNKQNWSHKNLNILGKLSTSLPSRILIPWTMAGIVFSKWTPVAWGNLIKKEPTGLVLSTYHSIKSGYEENVIRVKESIYRNADDYLQRSVRQARKSIINKLND
ncbi:hypothetical protein NCAS_0G02640 [Naumovozyma castellii]|uniref:Uncharacterized protein n=1 Tax=Naumovozyma castellii TaxID=27288 RepID=G0VIB6_NAUCA|nr:hypothetical protein NCAS_0G02640 [Naumovozyma castellii CBS 4309]CCC71151.1 hypothetical protein NCAS_0G02640 [Naumovozyma castellii CBS 4309]